MAGMRIRVRKDGKGYLAEVIDQPHLFAWGLTKDDAKKELAEVADMMLDYHLEQAEIEREVKTKLARA